MCFVAQSWTLPYSPLLFLWISTSFALERQSFVLITLVWSASLCSVISNNLIPLQIFSILQPYLLNHFVETSHDYLFYLFLYFYGCFQLLSPVSMLQSSSNILILQQINLFHMEMICAYNVHQDLPLHIFLLHFAWCPKQCGIYILNICFCEYWIILVLHGCIFKTFQ